MKILVDQDWCLRMAELEDGHEVGAGGSVDMSIEAVKVAYATLLEAEKYRSALETIIATVEDQAYKVVSGEEKSKYTDALNEIHDLATEALK